MLITVSPAACADYLGLPPTYQRRSALQASACVVTPNAIWGQRSEYSSRLLARAAATKELDAPQAAKPGRKPGKALLSSVPDLSAQWLSEANGDRTPDNITLGSRFKATWRCNACACGHPHVWQARVADRAGLLRSGCPVCRGKQPCACSSLAARFPAVAEQWDHERNAELKPEQVTTASNKVVHWVCKEHSPAHSWQTAVGARTKLGRATSCPLCAQERRTQPRQRRPSLAEGAPEVAAQLHPARNDGLIPASVQSASSRKVWWLCREGRCSPNCKQPHEWQACVADRVIRGSGCPFCSGRRPCTCNSLAVLHPELIYSQWDFPSNEMRPESLMEQSNKRVHWVCSRHDPPHRWVATPNHRFSFQSTGCPACSAQRRRKPAVAAA